MFKSSLALVLLAAAPALAHAQPAGMPADIQPAAQAFGQCIGKAAQGLGAAVTPEAGAKTILAGCAAERTALEGAVESFIATSPMSDAEKAGARQQMRAEMAKAETEIAQMIRQRRSAATAPAK